MASTPLTLHEAAGDSCECRFRACGRAGLRLARLVRCGGLQRQTELRMRLEESFCRPRTKAVSRQRKRDWRSAPVHAPVSPTKDGCCATGDAGGGTLMQGGVRNGEPSCCACGSASARERLRNSVFVGTRSRTARGALAKLQFVTSAGTRNVGVPRASDRRRRAASGARTSKGAADLGVCQARSAQLLGTPVHLRALA